MAPPADVTCTSQKLLASVQRTTRSGSRSKDPVELGVTSQVTTTSAWPASRTIWSRPAFVVETAWFPETWNVPLTAVQPSAVSAVPSDAVNESLSRVARAVTVKLSQRHWGAEPDAARRSPTLVAVRLLVAPA